MTSRSAERPGDPGPRAVRAGLVGTVVALCATAAHTLAGGSADPAPVAVVALAGSVVAWLLSGHRLVTSQLLGLLLLGQAGLHLASGGDHGAGPAMPAAHLAATAASLVLVRHGEDAWGSVARLVARLLPVLVVLPALPVHRRVLTAATARRPHGTAVPGTLGGRAPPARA